MMSRCGIYDPVDGFVPDDDCRQEEYTVKPFVVKGRPKDLKSGGYEKMMLRAEQYGFRPGRKSRSAHIREKSDEELAGMIALLVDCVVCPCWDEYDLCNTEDGSCQKRWLDWLREEVEGV